ncbi:MAG TPA: hypothetical protein VK487_01745 [Candidatus Bathyarchaeia archaeon]|nr:hypothetical protein [Candidatus Bathyarchaeia archaeon]
MVRQDGAEIRKERLRKIGEKIQAAFNKGTTIDSIPLTKTIAILGLETGLTKERLTEYLEFLQEAGKFSIDIEGDKIWRVTEPA